MSTSVTLRLAFRHGGNPPGMTVTRRARTVGGVPQSREAIPMILIVQHTVRDYDAWKPVFDEHEGVRVRYGCQGHTIYRDADDPNSLTLLFRYESLWGNTAAVARAIAEGLGPEARALTTAEATTDVVAGADVIVASAVVR